MEKVMDMFSSDSEEKIGTLVTASREKLANVFNIDVLKDMNWHFASSLIILILFIKLYDGREISIINIQEAQDETD